MSTMVAVCGGAGEREEVEEGHPGVLYLLHIPFIVVLFQTAFIWNKNDRLRIGTGCPKTPLGWYLSRSGRADGVVA